MSKKAKTWYGFLDAGKKSSPVLMDPTLDTGDPATLYIFNLQRNQVIEYKRELIEPKLRDLNGKEADTVETLKKAFKKARKEFTPRRAANKIPVGSQPASTKPPEITEPDIVDIDDADDLDIDDDIALDDDD